MGKLKGKKIYCLGSSVTYGYATQGVSFVEMLGKETEATYVKDAVNGTTLAACYPDSYLIRGKNGLKDGYDVCFCQLSTNDAVRHVPLGDVFSHDEATTAGAITSLILFCKRLRIQPMFFSSPKLGESDYSKTVELMHELAAYHQVPFLDLYSDKHIKAIIKMGDYMADDVHPTLLGYEKLFVPEMVKFLKRYID